MQGAWHYHKAETLLQHADQFLTGSPDHDALVRLALVHAQLATAAATIDAGYGVLSISADQAWERAMDTTVLGGPPVEQVTGGAGS